ncbi:MAG: hypothetical protein WEF53_01655 [Bacteroidota bacterium]
MNPKLLDRISAKDIAVAYDFEVQGVTDSSVTSLGLASELVEIADDFSIQFPPRIKYRIEIRLPNGGSILEFPFIRFLYPDKQLWGAYCREGIVRNGRVAENANLAVMASYQRRGIATLVYKLEESLYKKWGAVEIQLVAVQSGRDVWRKFGFILHCDDINIVEYFFEEWCEETGIKYIPLEDVVKYPREFLLSRKLKQFRLFKEI